MAPLLFLALGLTAASSGRVSNVLLFCALLSLSIAGLMLRRSSPDSLWTAPLAAMTLFAAWIAFTDLWVQPVYSPNALYQAALIWGGFIVSRAVERERFSQVAGVAVVFAVALATWALWNHVVGGEQRARSPFGTPAALAAALNIFLLPLLIFAAHTKPSLRLLSSISVVTVAFGATQSRGGWLALSGGLLLSFALLRRSGAPRNSRALAYTATAFAVGMVGSGLLLLMIDTSSRMAGEAAMSFRLRLDLYELAVKSLGQFPLLLGAGSGAFGALLRAAGTPQYAGRSTEFVHDDYLQMLLEFGLPGLAGLLLIVALPLWSCWRAMPVLRDDDAITAAGLAAGASSMAVHALGDFPFYVPLCALMFGGTLGLLDARLVASDRVRGWAFPSTDTFRRACGAAVATLLVWILARPAAAEAAAEYAFHEWRAGRNPRAAVWFESARRLDSRDWRYHWYAGQFWFSQAQSGAGSAAAQRADEAFAAGMAANRREVGNFVWRISTQITLRSLLPSPADYATVRSWLETAEKVAPLDVRVAAQRVPVERLQRAPAKK